MIYLQVVALLFLTIMLSIFVLGFCAALMSILYVNKKNKNKLWHIIEIMRKKNYELVGYEERIHMNSCYEVSTEKIGGFIDRNTNTFVGIEVLENMKLTDIEKIY